MNHYSAFQMGSISGRVWAREEGRVFVAALDSAASHMADEQRDAVTRRIGGEWLDVIATNEERFWLGVGEGVRDIVRDLRKVIPRPD
jgi:hypothetical protein